MDTTRISLIEGLKTGQPEALERFAVSYQVRIKRWARRFTHASNVDYSERRREELAEEVSQEVMLQIRKKLKSYDSAKRRPGGFRVWLKKATRSVLVDFVRRNARHWGSGDSAVLAKLLEVPATAELEFESDKAIEDQLRKDAMHRLRDESPEECAIVDDLGWEDGRSKKSGRLPAKEVAEKQGKTVNAVLKIKNRILERLTAIVSELRKEVD